MLSLGWLALGSIDAPEKKVKKSGESG